MRGKCLAILFYFLTPPLLVAITDTGITTPCDCYLDLPSSISRAPGRMETEPQTSLPSVKIEERRNCGMFSLFFDVLYALWEFENGYLSALHVDFGTRGLYYDPAYGNNWWNYYCEPIILGKVQGNMIEREYGDAAHKAPWSELTGIPRMAAHQLILKYIHPKSHILKKVNLFYKDRFSGNYVIGVHYRGTDKIIELPKVSYEATGKAIQEVLDSWARGNPTQPLQIFIATDEQAFIDYARSLWGDCVCYRECIRSTNKKPIHYGQMHSPYRLGEEAIIDMLLLSRSDVIIRTSSNLSLWSTYFNPEVPVIQLSRRHSEGVTPPNPPF